MAAIADRLGQPLMPWQRLIADVAGEYDPVSGRPFYREIIVTVPRQQGKTTLLLAHELERALREDGQRIYYSAQTGWDARRKLLDDQVPIIKRSPLNAAVRRVLRGAGNESVVFRNSSRIDILATTKSSGHGRIVDLGVIDEAFDDQDDRREQAMKPAMSTRPHAQLWVVSTKGTNESTYLNRKLEVGAAAAAEDSGSGIAFFEWSAESEDDLRDESKWTSFMPALGRTVEADIIRSDMQGMEWGEACRAYANIPTDTDERVIPKEVWAKVAGNYAPQGGLAFAFDVGPTRDYASIAASDGVTAEVVEHRPGTGWLVARLRELSDKWGAPVVVDRQSAAGAFVAELDDVRLEVWGTDEVAAACGRFYDRVMDGDVRVRSHEGLAVAVAGAARRNVGDRWLWGRRTSSTDITPLVAVTLALAARYEEDTPPMVSFA